MRALEPRLRAGAACLVFVGNGNPAQAAGFAERHAGGFPVLTDPTRRVFAAVGMRRSLWATVHPRLLLNLLRALRLGFRQRRVEGDPWQQGGVLLFDGAGRVVHAQADRAGGDPLDLQALAAAIERTTSSRAARS
ncbi:MAG: AhpC/TSA family protein [Planctomycetes bacterium]|nr:AhpC/TSA family protein [Planctomycetota bacterium]